MATAQRGSNKDKEDMLFKQPELYVIPEGLIYEIANTT